VNKLPLNELIARARLHRMTPEEIREQRISFIYGQMDGALSRDHVESIVDAFTGLERIPTFPDRLDLL
jgi:hypothetical protein